MVATAEEIDKEYDATSMAAALEQLHELGIERAVDAVKKAWMAWGHGSHNDTDHDGIPDEEKEAVVIVQDQATKELRAAMKG